MKPEAAPGNEPTSSADATADGGTTLLELVLAEHLRRARPARIDGVVVGRLVAIGATGLPLVDYPESPAEVDEREAGLPARSMTAVGPDDVGREVALLFERGDPAHPVLIGFMHEPPAAELLAAAASDAPSPPASAVAPASAAAPEVESDGERLVFEAEREIVLRCGKASITLTRAGKILIKGAYVLTRSSGLNRILGGSVQIN